MNNIWIKSILGGILLLVFQVLVLNELDLSSLVYPQIYILIILSLPVNTKHWILILIGFFLGYFVDWFSDTQGLHAATLTFIAYLRYGYLKTVLDKDTFTSGIRPVYGNVENAWYIVYVTIFSFMFHIVLFFLSDFSFLHVLDTSLKILYSSSLTIMLILIIQFVFNSRVSND